jgi:hypothetical protein
MVLDKIWEQHTFKKIRVETIDMNKIKFVLISVMILTFLATSAYGIILSAPEPIGFGESKFGYINTTSEMDAYMFEASSGDNVLIRMSSSWYDCNFYNSVCHNNHGPQISLYAPNGTLLQSVSGFNYIELSQKLPDNGTYQFLVGDTDADDTGNYNVYIQRTNKPGKFLVIESGDTIAESINLSAEMDTYVFEASSGDNVLIRMSSSWYDCNLYNSVCHDNHGPRISLYAPNGTLLQSVSGFNYIELSQKLPDNGTYSILTGDTDMDNTGTYNIYFQTTNNPGKFLVIESGDTIADSINLSSEMDTYVFEASSGDNVLIRMSSSWYDCNLYNSVCHNNNGPQISLYAPNGTLLQSVNGFNYIELSQKLPVNGTYSILAGDTDMDNTGTYNIYFQTTNNPGKFLVIESDDTIAESINLSAEMDTYIFEAFSGDNVLIRMSSSWYDCNLYNSVCHNNHGPQISLYAPNGTLIQSVSGINYVELSQKLPDNGIYSILAGDTDMDNTGTYSLYFKNFNIHLSSITVTSPNGEEVWQAGTNREIRWTYTNPGLNVKIELLKGEIPSVINSSTQNDGSYDWIIPSAQAPGNDYKVRVTSTTNSAYTDSSNNNFTINDTGIPPVADCGTDKLKCENVGAPVQFDGSASSGSIVSYAWEFGDATNGTGAAPVHKYSTYRWNGTAYQPFTVNLTVTDNGGMTNNTSGKVVIWIAGDANGDGKVNILDASLVGLKWNSNPADPCADLNNDGKVNILDASIIGLNWGKTPIIQ